MSEPDRWPTRLWVAGLSSSGLVRTTNEDRFHVSEIGGPAQRGPQDVVDHLSSSRGFVLAVYDGAGGPGAGEVASQVAATTVAASLTVAPEVSADRGARLETAIQRANKAILIEASADVRRRGMGCSATVVEQIGDALCIAQVGDTRAYVLRGTQLSQLTRDDTLVNEALALGQLRPEDVADYPYKSVVLSMLGVADTARFRVERAALHLDDALLICTDGLHGLVDDREIRAVMLRHREPGVAARVLLDAAVHAGGNDNIALVVARFSADFLRPPLA